MDDDGLGQFSQAFEDLRSSDSGNPVATELESIFESSVFTWPFNEDDNNSNNSMSNSSGSNEILEYVGAQDTLFGTYAPPAVEAPTNDYEQQTTIPISTTFTPYYGLTSALTTSASTSTSVTTVPFVQPLSISVTAPSLPPPSSSASALALSSGVTPFEFQNPVTTTNNSSAMLFFQNTNTNNSSNSTNINSNSSNNNMIMFTGTTTTTQGSYPTPSTSSSYSVSSSKVERIIPFVEEMYRQLQSLRSGFIQNEEFLTSVSTHVATISQLLPNASLQRQQQQQQYHAKHPFHRSASPQYPSPTVHLNQQEFLPIPTTLKMLRANLELRSEWPNNEIYLAQHFLNSNDIVPQTRVVFKRKAPATFHLQLRFGNEVLQVYEPAFLETTKKNASSHSGIKLEDDDGGGASAVAQHQVWRYEHGTTDRCELNSRGFPAFGQGRQVFFFLVCKYEGELYKTKILLAKKDYENQNNARGSSSSTDKKPPGRERIADLVLSITSLDDLKRELNTTKRQRT